MAVGLLALPGVGVRYLLHGDARRVPLPAHPVLRHQSRGLLLGDVPVLPSQKGRPNSSGHRGAFGLLARRRRDDMRQDPRRGVPHDQDVPLNRILSTRRSGRTSGRRTRCSIRRMRIAIRTGSTSTSETGSPHLHAVLDSLHCDAIPNELTPPAVAAGMSRLNALLAVGVWVRTLYVVSFLPWDGSRAPPRTRIGVEAREFYDCTKLPRPERHLGVAARCWGCTSPSA